MDLDKIKKRLAEIESTHQQHYDELNRLYAQVLEQDSTFLDEYPLSYLMKFSAIGDYVIGRLKHFYQEDANPDYKKVYLYSWLVCALFNGNITKYNLALAERVNVDATGLALGYDFRPLSGLTLIEDNDFLRIVADSETDIKVCKHLVSGLTEIIRGKFEQFAPKPSIFMLRGRGPSPFNPKTNCAFMMVGHYQGTDFEQMIFRTSITHEMTHLKRALNMRLPINESNIEAFHFFDEGLAMQNGYSILAECPAFYRKFLNCAWLIHKYTTYSTVHIMEKWSVFRFKEHHIPVYEYACAFVNWLDELYPDKLCNNFLKSWLGQKEITTIQEYFPVYYGVSLEEIASQWEARLDAYQPLWSERAVTNIENVSIDGNTAVFKYTSEYDLWPENNIFCVYDDKALVRITSHQDNKYRYQNQGSYDVIDDVSNQIDFSKLEFLVLADDVIERCRI